MPVWIDAGGGGGGAVNVDTCCAVNVDTCWDLARLFELEAAQAETDEECMRLNAIAEALYRRAILLEFP